MKSIPFSKMSGSGNDFIVVDNRNRLFSFAELPAFTRAVCRHRLSVGADGVVLIEHPDPGDRDAHFRWRYINADGSNGEMCGNGAMCGARFAVLHGIAPNRCVFRTDSGLVQAEVAADPEHDPRVAIAVEDPGPLECDIAVEAAGRTVTLHAIRVGVPHVVLVVDDADAFCPGEELVAFGRAVRYHQRFAPAGTNVNVISVRPDGSLRMRTYERGVEAETLACGTGSIASAIVAHAMAIAAPPVEVVTSSGRVLRPDFRWEAGRATGVTLQGEARLVARGEILPDAWA